MPSSVASCSSRSPSLSETGPASYHRRDGTLPRSLLVMKAPPSSSTAASAVGRGNRRRDTGPEIAVRRVLWAAGLRYRVDYPITTPERTVRPDVVLVGARIALFIDGCFWHACPQHGTQPTVNGGYWSAKLTRNVERDRAVNASLSAAGWRVIRAWEHEPSDSVLQRVIAALAGHCG